MVTNYTANKTSFQDPLQKITIPPPPIEDLLDALPFHVRDVSIGDLTQEEKAIWYDYTSGRSATINSLLWRKRIPPEYQTYINTLINSFTKLPICDGTCFRGASASHFGKLSIGERLTMLGFVGFSKDRTIAYAFHEGIIFALNKGHRSGRELRNLSYYPNEDEVLFGPGTIFEVLSRTETEGLTIYVIRELQTTTIANLRTGGG